ncbi:tyrosine-type recombinase/integrase [Limosilactobacillus antri]|uniref:Phage integrase SAM-like domain protein n=1 Tax=Limosilactobacillus antri DSM 16041 TaxID=525309 RepID=C8P848_9LACO|nr:tyrosine-type recombinase/integrase [Limosilactobacillus antri]EEW53348.1 phage integrase SAM-like domain protein [Limosilactobacillus antri DSM 16041]KRK59618.1 tyrosine recombinase XerD [Limosilactobacillus antri DSM 16041]
MDELVDKYLAYLKSNHGRSANTLLSYRRDLDQAVAFFRQRGVSDWTAVDQYQLLALVAEQKKRGRSPATINRQLSALRQFYRYLVRHQQLRFNPTELIDNQEQTDDTPPVILTAAEIKQLLAAPNPDHPLGKRDRAMLAVLATTGMRVSELVALLLTDLHLDIKMLRLGSGSRRERLVPVSDQAVQELEHYLAAVRPQLAAMGEQAVFVNAHGHQLTRQGIWKKLRELVRRAGIEKTVTPRTLRYSFAVQLLQSGADGRLIQEMLGYSELRAIKPYLKMTVQELSADYRQHQPKI